VSAYSDGSEEALQLAEERFLVAECRRKVRPRQLHEAGARDVIGHVAPAADAPCSSLSPVYYQGRSAPRCAQRRSGAETEEHWSFGSDRVQDGTDAVHACLQRGHTDVAV
jgi:hypothetical protein